MLLFCLAYAFRMAILTSLDNFVFLKLGEPFVSLQIGFKHLLWTMKIWKLLTKSPFLLLGESGFKTGAELR